MSEWTLETLKAHFEQRFNDSDKAIQAALLAADKAVQAALSSAKEAVTKAENATERRFEAVNEFRQALNDQAAGYMTRTEVVALADRNADGISALKERVTLLEGRRQGVSAGWSVLVAAVLVVAAVVTVVVSLR